MLDFTPEQLAQLRAEKLDAARKEGRLRRIGGASRESVASDFYTDGEVRHYTLAGWAAEDAKLADPDSYIVQDGFRI